MQEVIGRRILRVKNRESEEVGECVVEILQPFTVHPDSVSFAVDEQSAGCEVRITGLGDNFTETIYGADSIQALQLSSDVDSLLRRFEGKYEFYFVDGSPYFE